MSENLNSYADSVLEGKIKNEGADTEAQIAGLDSRVSALEEGGSGGGGVLSVGTDETYTLDKTWKEINDAVIAKIPVFLFTENEESGADTFMVVHTHMERIQGEEDQYVVTAIMFTADDSSVVPVYLNFITNSENGYPAYSS